MTTAVESRDNIDREPEPNDKPDISVCESAPGTSVFIESENTDGWIASNTTFEASR